MCLKEYQKILQGGVVRVYIDHKNLTFNTLSIQQVLRWRIFMNEFDLSLGYIEVKNNVLADAFLRLPVMDQSVAVRDNNNQRKGTLINFHTIKVPRDNTLIDDECFFTVEEMYIKDKRLHKDELYFSVEEEEEIMDLFLNLPPIAEM